MLTEEQKKLRKNGIGGSDIGIILGLNPYKDIYELYIDKTEDLPEDELSPSLEWGNLLEDVIASKYANINECNLTKCQTVFHPNYPFLFANPDFLIEGQKKGLEIKTANARMDKDWGESGSNIIPPYYYSQIAHYMMVLDYDSWDLAVLIGGQDFRVYSFERDKEVDKLIIEKATEFWEENVLKRVPPPLGSDLGNKTLLRKLFNKVNDEILYLDADVLAWKFKYKEAKEEERLANKKAQEAMNQMLIAMGNAGEAKLPDGSSFKRIIVKTKGYTVEPKEGIRFVIKEGK